MAIVDDKTVFSPGIRTGEVNHMRLGDTPDGRALLQFVQYGNMTGNHVDEATIVGEATLSKADLNSLHELMTDWLSRH